MTGWYDVPRWEGLYEINSRGQVRRKNGSFMIGGLGSKGYRIVTLCRNAHQKTQCVHKLMAETFLGPRPAGMQVNHIDGDPMNNRVENLEYVTLRGNTLHAFRLGLRPVGDKHWSRRMPWKVRRGQENGNSRTARARRAAQGEIRT